MQADHEILSVSTQAGDQVTELRFWLYLVLFFFASLGLDLFNRLCLQPLWE